MIKAMFIFTVAFLLGMATYGILAEHAVAGLSMPFGSEMTADLAGPQDHIKEESIHIYSDRVVIDIADPQWASFTPTHSMDPVLDEGNNAIEVVPKNMDEIAVGDIISYVPEDGEGAIIHRVVEKGRDDQGWYLIMKGDNNPIADPGKIRFSQVRRMVVGIIY